MSLLNNRDALANLDSETRQKLVDLLQLRSLYGTYQSELARLQVSAVEDPTDTTIKAVENYSENTIKPLKETINALVLQIARSMVSLKMPKSVPSSLDELFQIINPSALLTALGIDSGKANSIIESLREWFDI